jgi:hypothetical protein
MSPGRLGHHRRRRRAVLGSRPDSTRILIITFNPGLAEIYATLEAGAAGCLGKNQVYDAIAVGSARRSSEPWSASRPSPPRCGEGSSSRSCAPHDLVAVRARENADAHRRSEAHPAARASGHASDRVAGTPQQRHSARLGSPSASWAGPHPPVSGVRLSAAMPSPTTAGDTERLAGRIPRISRRVYIYRWRLARSFGGHQGTRRNGGSSDQRGRPGKRAIPGP